MNILKVSFVSAIETGIKLIAGFLVIKLLAYYSGPEALARFGQFQNVISFGVALVSGSFLTGLVKYIAETNSSEKPREVYDYLSAALQFGTLLSLLMALFFVALSETISVEVFGRVDYYSVFYVLAVSLFFVVIYQVAIAYLNGMRMVKWLIATKLSASVFLLVCGGVLVYFWGLLGGVAALCAMYMAGALVGLYFLKKNRLLNFSSLKFTFNIDKQKKLFSYWLMALVTLVSAPVVLLLIRSYIADGGGWEIAGLWEAMWKITELSLLLVTTALTVYYVPSLSQSETASEEKGLLIKVLSLAFVSAAVISGVVYVLRDFVVIVLFSDQFVGISDVLGIQLVGGVVRVIAWVIGFHIMIKSKPSLFVTFELLSGLVLLALSIFLYDLLGLEGLAYAFLINNVIYVCSGVAYFKSYFGYEAKSTCPASV